MLLNFSPYCGESFQGVHFAMAGALQGDCVDLTLPFDIDYHSTDPAVQWAKRWLIDKIFLQD